MFYDTFKALCDNRGISASKACLDMGLSRSIAAKWKNTETSPSAEVLPKIAKYFGVTTDYLLSAENKGHDPIVRCVDCGIIYNEEDPEESARHAERHANWKKAVDKFGFCWPPAYREEQKSNARNKIRSQSLSENEYFDAQTAIFKALFSRSLEGCDYNLAHVSFKKYVAMLLNQDQWRQKLPPHIYMRFTAKYGVLEGIPSGSYYQIEKMPAQRNEQEISFDDFTYAMQAETKDLTEMDKQILLSMAKQLNDARKQKNGDSE